MPGDSFCIQYTNCTGCPKNVENILVYRNLPKGEHIPKDKCTQNCMLFMIKGELLINSEEHPGITLRERQIVLQAIGSKVEILALTDVEYVVYWFNELPLLCEERYKEMMEQAEAPLTYTPLIMSERLYHLVTSMPEFLAEENPCSKYIDLKCKELVFLITNFYPLPQLGSFFYPISTYTESFHYFVIQNYSNVKNVEEFAHLGGYTTTTFRRLFKNLYGMPVYEWILEKKREGILEDLQHTKMRITEICNRYGFDSLSHFAHFCKDSFGDTPRALRKKAASGEKTVGRKVVMSVTGIALVLFLTFHMAMNLVAIISADGYNMICEFLGANWYALVATAGLAALFVIHIIYAFWLTMQNRKARGSERYAVTDKPKTVEWASQNMLVLGLIVIVGLGLHLFNFWAKMQLPELMHNMGMHADTLTLAYAANGAYHIQQTFSCPVYVVLYLVWLFALWFHLTHGFWSSMQSLGWNNKVWIDRWKCISNIYSTIVVLGFALVVVVFFVKTLICGGAC